jgi:hypothetical protein
MAEYRRQGFRASVRVDLSCFCFNFLLFLFVSFRLLCFALLFFPFVCIAVSASVLVSVSIIESRVKTPVGTVLPRLEQWPYPQLSNTTIQGGAVRLSLPHRVPCQNVPRVHSHCCFIVSKQP